MKQRLYHWRKHRTNPGLLRTFINNTAINGPNKQMRGDCSGLFGNCTELRGNCSGLQGDCSNLRGDCSGLQGNCSELRGDCSGLYGDCSNLSGDCSNLRGDCSRLFGNCTELRGNCSGLRGDCSGLYGDCSGLYGDCSNLRGDCSGLYGDCSGLYGDCSNLRGDCSGLQGDCSGLSGDCTGIFCDLDYFQLTDKERKSGIDIYEVFKNKMISTEFGSEFDSAPLEQKRMMVLFDALDAIASGINHPILGSYVTLSSSDIKKMKRRQALSIKDNPVQKCRACALGSIFLSYCRFENGFTYDEADKTLLERKNTFFEIGDEILPELFRNMFSEEQLLLIEECFEFGRFNNEDDDPADGAIRVSLLERDSDSFLKKYKSTILAYRKAFPIDADRIVAILYNMIVNDGVFKPEKDI